MVRLLSRRFAASTCNYRPIYAAYESFRLHRPLLAFGSDRQTSTARLQGRIPSLTRRCSRPHHAENMRAVPWRRASFGAGFLCYRCIQIAPERSSTGSEQTLQTLRDRFTRRTIWLCAHHVGIASHAEFLRRNFTGKKRSYSNTRGSTRCRGVEEEHRPVSSAHTQAVRKIIEAGCKRKPFRAVRAIGAAWIGRAPR